MFMSDLLSASRQSIEISILGLALYTYFQHSITIPLPIPLGSPLGLSDSGAAVVYSAVAFLPITEGK